MDKENFDADYYDDAGSEVSSKPPMLELDAQ